MDSKTCPSCGKRFQHFPSEHPVYCSKLCYVAAQRAAMTTAPSRIRELYESGLSIRSVASALGIGPTVVRKHLKREGVISRDRLNNKDNYRSAHPIREDAFSAITEESAYWIGFLLADGCITESAVRLGLKAGDRSHLEKFAAFLRCGNKIGESTSADGFTGQLHTSARFSVKSRRLVAELARHGVVPRKTTRESAPVRLRSNRDFWRGVIDGDGTIHNGIYPVLNLVGSEALTHQFADYLLTQGVNTRAKPHRRYPTLWTYSVSGAAAIHAVEVLYLGAVTVLERKNALARLVMAREIRHYHRGQLRLPLAN